MSTYTAAFTANSANSITSLGGSQGYVPEIWTGKFLEKFYKASVFADIANTDYQGEITAYGDKVLIRTVPNITINSYEIGQTLSYERPAGAKVELLIDKGKYFAFSVTDVERKQSDLNYVDAWSKDAAQQMKTVIDADVLQGIYADPNASNKGATAGAISSNLDLGVLTASSGTSTVVALSKTTIIEKIIHCGQALDEQNIPDDNRWIILPAWAIAKLKASDIKDASLTGDSMSPLRNGKVGMIDRFTIYKSNNVKHVTDTNGTNTPEAFYCMFGHKGALTFASQLVENEKIKNPNDFGDLIRGLQVYGYKTVQPTALGALLAYSA